MALVSAGLLMFRRKEAYEFFLVHPGGPYFTRKDLGWWTIPKGLPEANEGLLDAACREFTEETGIVPTPPYHALGHIRQKGGKTVYAWAFEGSWSPEDGLPSNTFLLEWPPRSGVQKYFPEVDQARWFSYHEACARVNGAQKPLLDRLPEILI